jgi:hypothetical protein
MVLCHPRWLPTLGLTEFVVCWGGAGFEPRTTEDLNPGLLADLNPGLLYCLGYWVLFEKGVSLF